MSLNFLKRTTKIKYFFLEQEIKNIVVLEEKYNNLIKHIQQTCDNKISEIKVQYNSNTSKINQQYLVLLNEMRNIRTNYIYLSHHYDKMNELNSSGKRN